jgi:ABC-2 type transport system ATP-binding protein
MKGNTRMTNNENLAVEAHGLVKTFGDNRAVDGVSLEIPRGSIWGGQAIQTTKRSAYL